MNSPHFQIKKNEEGYPHFAFVVDGDNEGHGETYATQQMCDKGIASVRANCKKPELYEDRITTKGKFYFVLKAENGEIIYTGKSRKTEIERDRSKELLMHFGETCEVLAA